MAMVTRLVRGGGSRHMIAIGRLVLTAAAAVAPPPAGAQPAARPAPAEVAKQAAEVQKLLIELRKSALSSEQKEQVIAKLLELGDEGPRRLATQCERDFRQKHGAYLAKLERGASDALKAGWKGKGNIEQQVAELRKTVLDTSKVAGLTKEQIVQRSDPAMEKLDALMTVTPERVLEAQPELKQLRQEALDVATIWGRAVAKLPEDRRKGLSAGAAAPPEVAAVEADLASKETLAAMMATPMGKPDRAVLLANEPLAAKLDPEEARGILILNLMRVRLGIGAQALDPKLCDASRGHSKDMKERGFFAHESPVAGKEDPWKRAALAGTSASAENIYVGSTRGADAIKGWWHSPGHHKNMLGGGARVGLGRHESHWTQMFGG